MEAEQERFELGERCEKKKGTKCSSKNVGLSTNVVPVIEMERTFLGIGVWVLPWTQ